MNDKKQIEEIEREANQLKELAKIIRFVLENRTDIQYIPDLAFPIAKELLKHYQPKLPENAVVIPEKITEQTSPSDLIKIAKYNESVRKKTAERDFCTIIKALEERKERVKAFYGIAESVGADIAIRTVKELAKQYGVDLGE